jgi:uncharacterized membrane protein
MKNVLGLLMILGGVILGLYLGLWLCFIGGIVQIINELKSPETANALAIAWGIVKIALAGAVGWLSAAILILPGIACFWD